MILILFSVLANFISQTQFKSVALILPIGVNFFDVLELLVKNYKLYLGFLFFGLSSILWILGLKGLTLTRALSILSLNYILILGYGKIQLNEELSVSRIFATFLILLGILMLNKEKSR